MASVAVRPIKFAQRYRRGHAIALREQLDPVSGKMPLLRRLAALQLGQLTSTLASAKASLRAIARRWLLLDAEIKQHDAQVYCPSAT